MTSLNVKKPSSKLDWFFKGYKIKKGYKLQADKEAMYSITQSGIAQQISNDIKRIFPRINKNSIITDLTACVGGNTINFAKNFKFVNAIEIDDEKFKMLINNASAIGVSDNINFINNDGTVFVKELIHDVVFIDPPWGGVYYKSNNVINLMLNDRFIEDIIINDIMDTTNYIVIKVPVNFDINNFNSKIKNYFKVQKIPIKNKMIILYLTKKLTTSKNS